MADLDSATRPSILKKGNLKMPVKLISNNIVRPVTSNTNEQLNSYQTYFSNLSSAKSIVIFFTIGLGF